MNLIGDQYVLQIKGTMDMAGCGSHLGIDQRACYFHQHIGEKAVREAADQAIEKWQKQS